MEGFKRDCVFYLLYYYSINSCYYGNRSIDVVVVKKEGIVLYIESVLFYVVSKIFKFLKMCFFYL